MGLHQRLSPLISSVWWASPAPRAGSSRFHHPLHGLCISFLEDREGPWQEHGGSGALQRGRPGQPVLVALLPQAPNGPDCGCVGRRHQRLGRQLPPEPGRASPQGECYVLEGASFTV